MREMRLRVAFCAAWGLPCLTFRSVPSARCERRRKDGPNLRLVHLSLSADNAPRIPLPLTQVDNFRQEAPDGYAGGFEGPEAAAGPAAAATAAGTDAAGHSGQEIVA